MPELVSGGPIIPVQLMNRLDSGRAVFFCGAGVSVGTGSGLPTFVDLVQHVYGKNGMTPDDVEKEALHHDEADKAKRRPQLDKALDLLERSHRLGASALRRTVIERLSQAPTGALPVHEALIALSRHGDGVRLVTTNFDKRFEEAEPDLKHIDAAPKLPIPRRHSWKSLVHLHGRINEDDDGTDLVLTAADFGRAYLTDRWAARFVTELFREFTVVFVGYSVADPVMSYMVDALAAERKKGAQFADAYAFASYDGTPPGLAKARDTWRAKNVDPILYDARDHHQLLTDTLEKWADIQSDPLRARPQIAINEIMKLPAGPDDPVVERVVWALESPSAAQALANAPAIVDEDEFTKIGRWLEYFSEAGLLQFPAGEARTAAIGEEGGFIRLVDSGFHRGSARTLDATRSHLSRWIARHAHVPQVVTWVARKGGCMHAGLKSEIRMQLGTEDTGIPRRLRFLWSVLLKQEPLNRWDFLWTRDHYRFAVDASERREIEDEVVASLDPHLRVLAGPSAKVRFKQYMTKAPTAISPLEACAHLRLFAGDSDHQHTIESILENHDFLARHAPTFSRHLEKALELAKDVEDIFSDSSFYRPSIAPHGQNRHDESWMTLIDLVRDGYGALAGKDRAGADNLLRQWLLSTEPLFARLALHALTENPKSDISLARKLLIAGRQPGLWRNELRREVLRFLRQAGARLPRPLRVALVRAIHAGPKQRAGEPWTSDAATVRRETGLRLHKLAESGARIDKRSQALADEAGEAMREMEEDREEFIVWTGGGWIGPEELTPADLLEGDADAIAAAIREETIDAEAFRNLAAAQPQKAADALVQVGGEGRWPAPLWQGLLWSIPHAPEQPDDITKLRENIADTLMIAPEALFEEVGTPITSIVEERAKAWGTEREEDFEGFWTRAWEGAKTSKPVKIVGIDDPMTDAVNHPAGKLAEAALVRLSKYKPEVGKKLPEKVKPYFDAMGDSDHGHFARVMLAARLHYLHAIDPEWVEEKLVPYMRPRESEEAANLWYAFGWSRTIGPNLLHVLKALFLEALQDADLHAQATENLTIIFMTVCLEAPDELEEDEVKGAVDSMAEDALTTGLSHLRGRLRGEPEERGRIWREKAGPWLERYWPRPAGRNTGATSKAMLEMLSETGDAFPEATEWALEHLKPIEQGLYRLQRSGHGQDHPNETFQVLQKVIAPGVTGEYNRYSVGEMLEEIAAAQPELQADPAYRRLHQWASH